MVEKKSEKFEFIKCEIKKNFPIKNLNFGLVCLQHSIFDCVFPDMKISSNRHTKMLLFYHPNNDFQLSLFHFVFWGNYYGDSIAIIFLPN
jgi:hypothetical protein